MNIHVEERILSRRETLAGFALIGAGHVATVAIPAALALWLAAPDNAYDEDRTWFFLYGFLLGQMLLLLVAVIAGMKLASSRPRHGAGIGVFVAWGAGLLLTSFLAAILWATVIHQV